MLLGALLLGNILADRADAGNVSIKQGYYIMAPCAMSSSTDGLFVIDRVVKKLNVYGWNAQGVLELVGTLDLAPIFEAK